MTLIERIGKSAAGAIGAIQYAERQKRFRNYVDRSIENEIVKGTVIYLQNLADFLLDNQIALRSLGATDADFDILGAVTNPVANKLNVKIDYNTVYNRKSPEENEIQATSQIDTRKDPTKLLAVVKTGFIGNETNYIYTRFQAFDAESKQLLPEGFICGLFDKNRLDKQERDELVTSDCTVRLTQKSKRVNIISCSDSGLEKMDYTYIGEMSIRGVDMGVLVNIIRENKKSSGGRGKKKELIIKPEQHLDYGVI